MSVWSRSYSDLTKLIKTHEEENDYTRQRLRERSRKMCLPKVFTERNSSGNTSFLVPKEQTTGCTESQPALLNTQHVSHGKTSLYEINNQEGLNQHTFDNQRKPNQHYCVSDIPSYYTAVSKHTQNKACICQSTCQSVYGTNVRNHSSVKLHHLSVLSSGVSTLSATISGLSTQAPHITASSTKQIAFVIFPFSTFQATSVVRPSSTSQDAPIIRPSSTFQVASIIRPPSTSQVASIIRPSSTSQVASIIRPSSTSQVASIIRPSSTSQVASIIRPSSTPQAASIGHPSSTSQAASVVCRSPTLQAMLVVCPSLTLQAASVVCPSPKLQAATVVCPSPKLQAATVECPSPTLQAASVIYPSPTPQAMSAIHPLPTLQAAANACPLSTLQTTSVIFPSPSLQPTSVIDSSQTHITTLVTLPVFTADISSPIFHSNCCGTFLSIGSAKQQLVNNSSHLKNLVNSFGLITTADIIFSRSSEGIQSDAWMPPPVSWTTSYPRRSKQNCSSSLVSTVVSLDTQTSLTYVMAIRMSTGTDNFHVQHEASSVSNTVSKETGSAGNNITDPCALKLSLSTTDGNHLPCVIKSQSENVLCSVSRVPFLCSNTDNISSEGDSDSSFDNSDNLLSFSHIGFSFLLLNAISCCRCEVQSQIIHKHKHADLYKERHPDTVGQGENNCADSVYPPLLHIRTTDTSKKDRCEHVTRDSEYANQEREDIGSSIEISYSEQDTEILSLNKDDIRSQIFLTLDGQNENANPDKNAHKTDLNIISPNHNSPDISVLDNDSTSLHGSNNSPVIPHLKMLSNCKNKKKSLHDNHVKVESAPFTCEYDQALTVGSNVNIAEESPVGRSVIFTQTNISGRQNSGYQDQLNGIKDSSRLLFSQLPSSALRKYNVEKSTEIDYKELLQFMKVMQLLDTSANGKRVYNLALRCKDLQYVLQAFENAIHLSTTNSFLELNSGRWSLYTSFARKQRLRRSKRTVFSDIEDMNMVQQTGSTRLFKNGHRNHTAKMHALLLNRRQIKKYVRYCPNKFVSEKYLLPKTLKHLRLKSEKHLNSKMFTFPIANSHTKQVRRLLVRSRMTNGQDFAGLFCGTEASFINKSCTLDATKDQTKIPYRTIYVTTKKSEVEVDTENCKDRLERLTHEHLEKVMQSQNEPLEPLRLPKLRLKIAEKTKYIKHSSSQMIKFMKEENNLQFITEFHGPLSQRLSSKRSDAFIDLDTGYLHCDHLKVLKETVRQGHVRSDVLSQEDNVGLQQVTRYEDRIGHHLQQCVRDCNMEKDHDMGFQLDREFDTLLADMKPYVLKLPHKAERQKCAVWIKKLCEPIGSGTAVRKTRSLYAQLMLKMLKNGSLRSPFDQKPEEGHLKPLSSYMVEDVPRWTEDHLGDTVGSSGFPKYLGNPAATSTWVSSVRELIDRPHSSIGCTLGKDPALSPIRNSELHHYRGYSADDMSVEMNWSPPLLHKQQNVQRSSSGDREKRHLPDVKVKESRDEKRLQEPVNSDMDWSKALASSHASSSYSLPKGTTFLDESSYPKPSDREVEVRTKMIEANFHKEKLKLQQKHDTDVQKILDRKNTEIEDMKSHYKAKSKEMEEKIEKLERKVQTLMKETEYIRQTKDKQISELKKMTEESNNARRSEFEKRLHEVMAEFEQVKFDLQKQHTQNIQEILDDTNNRLQRMEAEYSQQTTASTNLIKELESRVQQLMNEVDNTLSQRSVVEREKNEILAKNEKLTNLYDRLKEKLYQQEKDHRTALEAHGLELRSLKSKADASLEYIKQEHTLAASKAADAISELEEKVDNLRKSLKDAEDHRHRQIRELEENHHQDKSHAQNIHDKQICMMKKEIEQLNSDWAKKVAKLEQLVRDKEQEISRHKEQNHQHSLKAEQALEEFKAQVEKNQGRIYEEMKLQMQQVVNDLTKSKQAREKQSKEFSRVLEDVNYKHQHEIAEMKMTLEAEKSQVLRDFNLQKEYILKEHERDMENLKALQQAELQTMAERLKERQDKYDKSTTESERLIRELREELVQVNQLRKQQLVELGFLREEEKQKMKRDHEAELARTRSELEQQKLQLQKAHSTEMEAVLEKANDQLKSIERDYIEQQKKSAESIGELQSVTAQLKGNIKRTQESSEEKLTELEHQFEEEKQSLRKQYSQNISKIQRELDFERSQARSLERRLQNVESEHEDMITQVKLQFEEKIRGFVPVDLKQDLEDTISSLKSQVFSLQQRSNLLQEELDERSKNSLTHFNSSTSPTIKSAG